MVPKIYILQQLVPESFSPIPKNLFVCRFAYMNILYKCNADNFKKKTKPKTVNAQKRTSYR